MVKPVLLVEDDDDYRTIVAEAIEGLGLPTAQAVDGLNALKLLERDGAMAVITDWHMPRMDGCQLVTLMRSDERWSHIPVIFLSGSSPSLELKGPITFCEKMEVSRLLLLLETTLPAGCFRPVIQPEPSGRLRARTRRIFIGLSSTGPRGGA